jgi:hypothetical protein
MIFRYSLLTSEIWAGKKESRDWGVGPGVLTKPRLTPQFLTPAFPGFDDADLD